MAGTNGHGTIGAQHLGLRDQVLSELRQRIVNGDYPPGERLTEDRLAADFGVSRNPVREALRIVETEGFVEMLPRRGAFVATPDESTIADMFAVRERLETAGRPAGRRAGHARRRRRPARPAGGGARGHRAGRLLPGRRAEQRAAPARHRDQRQPVAVGDLQRALPARALGVPASAPPHRAPHSWMEHIRLVDAIEAGDADAAEAAAAAHVHAAGVAAGQVEDHPRQPTARPGTTRTADPTAADGSAAARA